jgi:hypothetical protein
MEFLNSDIGLAIASVLAGVGGAALSYATWKAANSPDLAKLKTAYPVLNLVLEIAAQTLTKTKYGFAFDAAYRIWLGKGVSPSEARKLAGQMIENFDPDKYAGTNWAGLNESQVAKGEEIAAELIPGFRPGQDVGLPLARATNG